MIVSVDLTIIPIGVGVSISPYIATCVNIIEKTGLDYELGPNGTSIEGEWNDVFECVKACHQSLHSEGVNRIFSTLKVNSRIDTKISFRNKVENVNSLLTNKNA